VARKQPESYGGTSFRDASILRFVMMIIGLQVWPSLLQWILIERERGIDRSSGVQRVPASPGIPGKSC